MPNPRPSQESASRPDPRQGVFETLLVAGGRPVELEAHLERMAASLRTLFGAELGADAGDLVLDRAAGFGLGRLRLTATPRGDGVSLEANGEAVDAAAVFAFAGRSIGLRSLVVPGGLGPHKWADRALLERAEADMADGTIALLVDDGGAVLEASRANVFAVRGGALVTPPADGRILPGVARAAVIDVAREAGREVREAPLTLAELAGADGAFLTGSVRGIEPVGSIDGEELRPAGDVGVLLAAALRRRWLKR